MNIQDKIWIIQNQIHELKLSISTEDIENYSLLYDQLKKLEQQLKDLINECN